MPLATLTLILPTYTTSVPGPVYTATQPGLVALATLVRYGVFLTCRRSGIATTSCPIRGRAPMQWIMASDDRQVWESVALLLVALTAVQPRDLRWRTDQHPARLRSPGPVRDLRLHDFRAVIADAPRRLPAADIRAKNSAATSRGKHPK